LTSINVKPSKLVYVFPLCCSSSGVERCRQERYVLSAMARGRWFVLPVVAPAARPSQVSLSAFVGGAMEAADVVVMSAAVQQKLNPTRFNDRSSTPIDAGSVKHFNRVRA
jgi:hypothetical protein